MALTLPDSSDTRAAGSRQERIQRFHMMLDRLSQVTLADNVDPLFDVVGVKWERWADPTRLRHHWSAIVERLDTIWDHMGDENSREFLLRWCAYQVLGPAHVRLDLEPGPYRKFVVEVMSAIRTEAFVEPSFVQIYEYGYHQFDFTPLGLDLRVIGQPLPLAQTMAFMQYAYRDEAANAQPCEGDIILDVGGCHGDTALWFASNCGDGHVHVFEPMPDNLRVYERNIALNPNVAGSITLHTAPLSSTVGEPVRIAGIGASAAIYPVDATHEGTVCETTTIDHLVMDTGQIPRVDFLKADVEGAEELVLRGALRTIAAHRPRVALACYHQDSDLWLLPELIESAGGEYRWYMQASTMTPIDTVLFGVPVT